VEGEVNVLSNTWPISGICGIDFSKIIPHELVKMPGQALPKHYDLLLLVGGVKSIEKTRQDVWFSQAVRDCDEVGIPICSICHGSQLLIEAEVVKGKRVLGYYSIRKDLENAGGVWAEEEDNGVGYVIDGGICSTAHYKHMSNWLEAGIGMAHDRLSRQDN